MTLHTILRTFYHIYCICLSQVVLHFIFLKKMKHLTYYHQNHNHLIKMNLANLFHGKTKGDEIKIDDCLNVLSKNENFVDSFTFIMSNVTINSYNIKTFIDAFTENQISQINSRCSIGFMAGKHISDISERGIPIDKQIYYDMITKNFDTCSTPGCVHYNEYLFGRVNQNIVRETKLLSVVNTTIYLIENGFVFNDSFHRKFSFCPSVTKLFADLSFWKVMTNRMMTLFHPGGMVFERNNQLHVIKNMSFDLKYFLGAVVIGSTFFHHKAYMNEGFIIWLVDMIFRCSLCTAAVLFSRIIEKGIYLTFFKFFVSML